MRYNKLLIFCPWERDESICVPFSGHLWPPLYFGSAISRNLISSVDIAREWLAHLSRVIDVRDAHPSVNYRHR